MKALVGAFNQENLLRDCENRLWNRWIVLQHYSLPRSNIPAWTGWGEQRISRAPLNIDIYKIPSSAPPLPGFRALAGPNTAHHQSCLGTWEHPGSISKKRYVHVYVVCCSRSCRNLISLYILVKQSQGFLFLCTNVYSAYTNIFLCCILHFRENISYIELSL